MGKSDKELIDSLKEDDSVFKQCLYEYFFSIVIKILRNNGVENVLEEQRLFSRLSKYQVDALNSELRSHYNFVVPIPVLSPSSFIIITILIIVPVVFIVLSTLKSLELLWLVAALFSLGFGLVIIFSLVLVVHFLKPQLLNKYEIPDVKTIRDYVFKIVELNHIYYQIDNYHRLGEEIHYLREILTNQSKNEGMK